jgi:hypothetical protein
VTNFKSGSGNLDFGSDDDESADSAADTSSEGNATPTADSSADGAEPASPDQFTSGDEDTEAAADDGATDEAPGGGTSETYPYFVRRSNVGDERDTRLEIHVRDKVADGEAQFRHALAEQLGTSDVSKTDAREFALLAAFQHPERVAELMREEGFDSLG